MEQESNSGEWVECVCDKRYEINLSYPYRIRRKDTKQLVREWVGRGRFGHGYVHVRLGSKDMLKHRVIALQFIPNPSNLSQVDHINGVRTDNHLSNIRWASASDNLRNRNGLNRKQYKFIDEIPTTSKSLTSYNNHTLDSIYIDRTTQKLYLFNGARIKELEPLVQKGRSTNHYNVRDVAGKSVHLSHNKLFPTNEPLDEPMDDETLDEPLDETLDETLDEPIEQEDTDETKEEEDQ